MDRDEFSRQLKELHNNVLFDVLSHHLVWVNLWPTEEKVDTLNRYNGFFFPVRRALLHMLNLQSAKLFDRNSRTISFPNLIKAASENPDELIPHANEGEVAKWEGQIVQLEELLDKLKHQRDQTIAHLDANPTPGPVPKMGEMDEFVEVVKVLFNEISRAHSRSFTSWDTILNRSETATTSIIDILAKNTEMTKAAWAERLARLGVPVDP